MTDAANKLYIKIALNDDYFNDLKTTTTAIDISDDKHVIPNLIYSNLNFLLNLKNVLDVV